MKMRILIVDDEYVVRKGMKMLIENASPEWTVIGQEADGKEALQSIRKEVPDVLITDIRMADVDGIQLAKSVRAKWPDMLIIVVSGYSEFQFAKEAVRFGALDYLLKPTAPEELVRALKHAETVLSERRNTRMEAILRNSGGQKETDASRPAAKNRLVEDAVTYMAHHYSQNLTTRDMADILHLNSKYFCDLFKKETGFTFLEYLTKIRIGAAKQILEEKVNVKSYEVASMVGYTDSSYFARLFKNATGMSPSEYKDNCGR